MSMSEWAKREVEIACKRENPDRKDGEWDYGCACYESALKAYLSLCEDGHNGMSFALTRSILNRLMDGLPLTPIEGNDEDWKYAFGTDEGEAVYQCKRMSGLFKYVSPDGTVTYSAHDYVCVDEDSGLSYHGGGAEKVLNEYRKPIEMPYNPPSGKYVVHTREYLTDRKNGDFDTKEYLYITTPENERIEVNRYFKDAESGYEEISREEFLKRVSLDKARKERESEGMS